MAISNADILGWLNANPNASDDLIYKTMVEAGVSPTQYLSATGKQFPRQTASPQQTSAPTVSNADILGWLNANPNASADLVNKTMAEAGVSASQYQSATGKPLPQIPQATTPQKVIPPPPLAQTLFNTGEQTGSGTSAGVALPPPTDRLLGGPVQMPPKAKVTDADILGWFDQNKGASDALIVKTMQEANVSPARLARVTGVPVAQVVAQYGSGSASSVTDYQGKKYDTATILKLAKQITPSIDPNAVKGGVFSTKGESIGFNFDEASRILGKAPSASEQVILDMARHLANEGYTDLEEVDATETNRRFGSTFTGGGGTIYEIKKNAEGKPIISTWSKDTSDKKTILSGLALAALAFGIPGISEGLLSAAPAGATIGTTALTAAEAAGLGLTAAEASALGLSAAEFAAAAGTAGAVAGTVGATGLTAAELAAYDLALGGAGGTAGATSLAGGLTTGATIPTITSLTGGSGLLTGAAGGITAESVAAKLAADAAAASTLAGTSTGALTSTLPAKVTTGLTNAAVSTAVNSLLGGGTTTSNLSNLFSGGLGTTGNLLQMQESKEAAQRAQARIDAETAAAKQAAAFRPVGMTTRFGTSQFQVDPVTGQLTSAGYTLSPEAKAQQDRFMALSQQGLTQAEQAQAQFAPLQTGAQRLFGLGNQYLAQSPEAVAQNYLNQQMALLQPGRELELANLQNRLQQQGRGGLAVAQGGTYGATTPELQALYNARAQQEAQLAAQAQQAGQQQVAFGAGLLGQGAQTMGQYYGGQQAAYAPYTTAMGQVQGLEALGQQPFTMGAQLGQTSSTAGARSGQLGLEGARLSTALATSADATRNLGAQSLIAAGSPNAQFGSALGGLLSGGLQSAFSGTGLGASGFGTGLAYGNQDLGLYL
jgi:hypothetical protein